MPSSPHHPDPSDKSASLPLVIVPVLNVTAEAQPE